MLLFVESEHPIRIWAINWSISLCPIFFFRKLQRLLRSSGQISVEVGWDYQQGEYQQICRTTVSWSCPTSGVFLSPSSPSSPPPSSSPSFCWSAVSSCGFVPVNSSLVSLPDDGGVLRGLWQTLLSLPLNQISKARDQKCLLSLWVETRRDLGLSMEGAAWQVRLGTSPWMDCQCRIFSSTLVEALTS